VDPADKVRAADVAVREEEPAARAALVGPAAAEEEAAECSAELLAAEVQVAAEAECSAGAED
jgi:hypothetical protein